VRSTETTGRAAGSRRATSDGADAPGAEPFVPNTTSLKVLNDAAQLCRGCHLYRHATQAVLGEGPRRAPIMLVGEQPGDQEDLQGHPFVGPAGGMLVKALQEAGLDREDVFLTNAVKHFKWEPRGKRRIHQKPRISEIRACRPWLEAELRIVKPQVVVCLGAVAAQAVFGSGFKLMQQHGQVLPSTVSPKTVATIHPSAVLRAPDSQGRREAFASLVKDLKTARKAITGEGC
jgi:DNA polymerase